MQRSHWSSWSHRGANCEHAVGLLARGPRPLCDAEAAGLAAATLDAPGVAAAPLPLPLGVAA
jgi:hypothetical protein